MRADDAVVAGLQLVQNKGVSFLPDPLLTDPLSHHARSPSDHGGQFEETPLAGEKIADPMHYSACQQTCESAAVGHGVEGGLFKQVVVLQEVARHGDFLIPGFEPGGDGVRP